MDSNNKVVCGTLEIIWDSGDDERQMLINIDPDIVGAPHTFELEGPLRDRVKNTISEGDRIEITYTPIEHELVDLETGRTHESYRIKTTSVRLLE